MKYLYISIFIYTHKCKIFYRIILQNKKSQNIKYRILSIEHIITLKMYVMIKKFIYIIKYNNYYKYIIIYDIYIYICRIHPYVLHIFVCAGKIRIEK